MKQKILLFFKKYLNPFYFKEKAKERKILNDIYDYNYFD